MALRPTKPLAAGEQHAAHRQEIRVGAVPLGDRGARRAAAATRSRTPGRPSAPRAPLRARRGRPSDRAPRSLGRASGSRERGRGDVEGSRFSALSSTPCQRAVGRRPLTQVDGNVEDRAADAAHELGLAVGLGLVVHAAQRSGARVEGGVALHDFGVQSAGGELLASNVRANQPRSSANRSGSISHARRLANSGVSRERTRRAPAHGSSVSSGVRRRTARPIRG